MTYSNFTAALDIGSTHIALAIGTKTTDGTINVIDYESTPSAAIKLGKITNESAIAKDIQMLILKIQQRNKIIIESAYVSTSSIGLYSNRISISKSLGEGSIVTEELLENLNTHGDLIPESNKTKRLYCKPLVYRIDGEKVDEVKGNTCQRIEADYLAVDADSESIERIKNTLRLAEIKMADMYMSPIIAAEATLSSKEKKEGVAVVEIGNASTKISIFKEDKLQYVSTIQLGCKLIVNDLSNMLNISQELAWKVFGNEQFGAVYTNLVEDAEMELITKNDIKKIFPTRFIVEIIEARLEEIILNVKNQIEKSGFMNLLISGLVISGKVITIKNLSHFVNIKTNFNVRISDIKANMPDDSNITLAVTDTEICGLLMLGKSTSKNNEQIEEKKVEEIKKKTTEKDKPKKEGKWTFVGMKSMFDGMFDNEETEF